MTAHLDFIHRPTARNWYHAHNASIVAGYVDNEPLAAEEGRVERFFINAVLVRVLFAHAPRFDGLYRWSSEVLALPALQRLLDGSTPTYAWDSEGDAQVWDFKPSTLARLGRWVVPVR